MTDLATNSESGPTSASTPSLSQTLSPTSLPTSSTNVQAFRKSEDGKKLAAWIQSEYAKAKSQRHTKFIQWVINLSYFYGRQWLESTSPLTPGGYDNRLFTPKRPPYARRMTVNRIRSYARTEHSKFISERPSAQVIPATAEDQDTMAAYAGEQVWESYSSRKRYEAEYAKSAWWTVLTGNGFMKTWWDQDCLDPATGQKGDISYGAVSPFNLYVPDIREEEIEGQPYIIHAYTKPIGWIRNAYKDELKGVELQPSTTAANQIVDAVYLNLTSVRQPDSCILYEAWFKPGAHKLLPNGGVIIQVDSTIISVYDDGMPYSHGEFPYSHQKHIPSGTFYGDSPIVDLIQLQREYNQLRSDISEAGRRMGRPQLVAVQGSIVAAKMTNEPGAVIQYRPGTAAPQPIPLSPLPSYLVNQQETILNDWEDISGQHAASTGSAPPGVTAGTALSFLQEQDNNFLTPQFDSIEHMTERIARQTLVLFNQYVDTPRRIKVIGADGSYDATLLRGSDIKGGLDIRIEKGSALSQSKAAKQAQVTQMFTVGLIPPDTALQLMELGGPQKVLDYVSAAKRKAQRENTKMKLLKPKDILSYNQMHAMAQQMGMGPTPDPFTGQVKGDPVTGNPTALPASPIMGGPGMSMPGPVIAVDNFDEHAIHIQVHNTFRMGEEYESLDSAIKQQFELHVQMHQQAMQQTSLQGVLSAMPSDGTAPPLGGSGDPQEGGPGGPGPGGPVQSPQGAPSGPPPGAQ